jgi:hypothetical protein
VVRETVGGDVNMVKSSDMITSWFPWEWADLDDPVELGDAWELMSGELGYYLYYTLEIKEHYWYAEVSNFGWRGQSGSAWIDAEGANDLLYKILPKTENHFNIYKYTLYGRKGFAIQNFHHDSPMGKEWYYVIPLTSEEWEFEDLNPPTVDRRFGNKEYELYSDEGYATAIEAREAAEWARRRRGTVTRVVKHEGILRPDEWFIYDRKEKRGRNW